MEERLPAVIGEVSVNTEVLRNVTIKPTLINFFFGKNGTGKSTITRQFRKADQLIWRNGVVADDFQIEIYDEEFIRESVQSYGNIPGVFTLSKGNKEKKEAIDEKTRKIKDISKQQEDTLRMRSKLAERDEKAYESLSNEVWNQTAEFRAKFREAYQGCRNDKRKFLQQLLQTKSVAYPYEDIVSLYETAFKSEAKKLPYFHIMQSAELPQSLLLGQPVYGSTSTPFAEFVKALNATSWIQHGHEHYQGKTDGRCPYCQQKLPATFEEDLSSCFDEQYRKAVDELQTFHATYRAGLNEIYSALSENLKLEVESTLIEGYRDRLELFRQIGQINMSRIKEKLQNPSVTVELEDIDSAISDVVEIAYRINDEVKAKNSIIDDRRNQQNRWSIMMWEYTASLFQNKFAQYISEHGGIEKKQGEITEFLGQLKIDADVINNEIKELNSQVINTTEVMENINRLIVSGGFQGFKLREKPGTAYVYQLVRDDGSVVKNDLSEGERNFISFLYFYHQVTGSQSDDGVRKNKIVVIDDPVTSMDSGSMFMIATLVRNLITICHNNHVQTKEENEDYIKQIFCLTHNPYFFKEITYNRLAEYDCAAFYELLKKTGNKTEIRECRETYRKIGGDAWRNVSPVKNYYDSLWYDFKNTDAPVTLMNTTRQILEHYFLQTCFYTNISLREALLEGKENEYEDKTEYDIAHAMVSQLTSDRYGMADGIYFDYSAIDLERCRKVFKEIFKKMRQDQHYNMMMGS